MEKKYKWLIERIRLLLNSNIDLDKAFHIAFDDDAFWFWYNTR